jgi:predicted DNA binding CopG/RHH family protein
MAAKKVKPELNPIEMVASEKKSVPQAEKGFKAKATRSAKKTAPVETPDAAPEAAVEAIVTEKPAKAAKPDKAEKEKAEKLDKAEKAEKPAKMKRLTLDVSKSLHKAIKARAVEEGVAMADMLRSLLEQNYVSK